MEFQKIYDWKDEKVSEILYAYQNSFPPDERRDNEQLQKLFNNENAEIISILNENENIGYLILWKLSDFVFIEHFEIFECFRGKSFGSDILQNLLQKHPKIVLESEPDYLSNIAAKRISFYKRNGFKVIDEQYIQPSYGEGKKPLTLFLLSSETTENVEKIKEEIYQKVYS